MTKFIFFITFLPFLSFGQTTKPIYINYIQKYKSVAIAEMKRKGIPASIKIGQAILESNAGMSELSICSQNHFGIKCGNEWNGASCLHEDDDYGSDSVLIKSCFRAFSNPELSFVAHSDFLTNPNKINRYGFLFQLDPKDYKSWAYGLLRSGYCTNPKYPELLIKIIEDYKLHEFDSPQLSSESILNEIIKNNKLELLLINQLITVEQIAKALDKDPKKLLEYNDLLAFGTDIPLNLNTKFYLEKKNRYWHGDEKYHTVSKGETMYEIAQNYGMRLERLYKKNRIPLESQPLEGEKLKVGHCNISKKEIPRYFFPKELIKDTTGIAKDTALGFEISPNVSIIDTPSIVVEEKVIKEVPQVVTEKKTEVIINAAEDINYHVVLPNETLYAISRKYKLTVDTLKQLNNMADNKIVVGQKLRLK